MSELALWCLDMRAYCGRSSQQAPGMAVNSQVWSRCWSTASPIRNGLLNCPHVTPTRPSDFTGRLYIIKTYSLLASEIWIRSRLAWTLNWSTWASACAIAVCGAAILSTVEYQNVILKLLNYYRYLSQHWGLGTQEEDQNNNGGLLSRDQLRDQVNYFHTHLLLWQKFVWLVLKINLSL